MKVCEDLKRSPELREEALGETGSNHCTEDDGEDPYLGGALHATAAQSKPTVCVTKAQQEP